MRDKFQRESLILKNLKYLGLDQKKNLRRDDRVEELDACGYGRGGALINFSENMNRDLKCWEWQAQLVTSKALSALLGG